MNSKRERRIGKKKFASRFSYEGFVNFVVNVDDPAAWDFTVKLSTANKLPLRPQQ